MVVVVVIMGFLAFAGEEEGLGEKMGRAGCRTVAWRRREMR